jgi:hypothetical protein
MSRRIALAFSLALTVVVAFAVASFASQAGWLQAQSKPEVASAENSSPQPPQPTDFGWQEPVVITEYVYQDVPVVVSRASEGEPEAAVTPNPPPILVNPQGDSAAGPIVNNTVSTSAPAPQINDAPPTLTWSHDDDGEDSENFGDEVQDQHQGGEREHDDEHDD